MIKNRYRLTYGFIGHQLFKRTKNKLLVWFVIILCSALFIFQIYVGTAVFLLFYSVLLIFNHKKVKDNDIIWVLKKTGQMFKKDLYLNHEKIALVLLGFLFLVSVSISFSFAFPLYSWNSFLAAFFFFLFSCFIGFKSIDKIMDRRHRK